MFGYIAALLQKTGILGLGLLMLVENLVPIIPSELILPMAGFEAAGGSLNLPGAIFMATLGSVIGGAAWYFIGREIGLERVQKLAGRHARWITLSPHEVALAEVWFRRWGGPAVCLGRSLPGIRGVICIPAGLARMPFGAFLAWSTLGTTLWSCLMIGAGYVLKARYAEVEHWLNPAADAFLLVSAAAYLCRVATFKDDRTPQAPQDEPDRDA